VRGDRIGCLDVVFGPRIGLDRDHRMVVFGARGKEAIGVLLASFTFARVLDDRRGRFLFGGGRPHPCLEGEFFGEVQFGRVGDPEDIFF
jgi:hypothetical protein